MHGPQKADHLISLDDKVSSMGIVIRDLNKAVQEAKSRQVNGFKKLDAA